MKKEYDFGAATQSTYAKKLKRAVTIRLDMDTIRYFKQLSRTTGLPYQTLINLYLRDCAITGREPRVRWDAARRPSNPVTRKSSRG